MGISKCTAHCSGLRLEGASRNNKLFSDPSERYFCYLQYAICSDERRGFEGADRQDVCLHHTDSPKEILETLIGNYHILDNRSREVDGEM